MQPAVAHLVMMFHLGLQHLPPSRTQISICDGICIWVNTAHVVDFSNLTCGCTYVIGKTSLTDVHVHGLVLASGHFWVQESCVPLVYSSPQVMVPETSTVIV